MPWQAVGGADLGIDRPGGGWRGVAGLWGECLSGLVGGAKGFCGSIGGDWLAYLVGDRVLGAKAGRLAIIIEVWIDCGFMGIIEK